MLEEALELGDEQLLGPEGRVAVFVGEVGGVAIAKLIVEDDGDGVGGGEVGEGEEVVVHDAWTAVENDEGATSGGLEVTKDLVPGLTRLFDVGYGEHDLSFHGET